MIEWIVALGLALIAVIMGLVLSRPSRRSQQSELEEFAANTEIDIPPAENKWPTVAVDLPLDLEPPAEPARLGYVDSTMPAIQDPAPLRAARSVANGVER